MPVESAERFNIKDLFLDARLVVCVDGTGYDYTGKETFSTSFFRESTGFGITNIDVEVNTSLQPIVEITIKDLYGKTVVQQGGVLDRSALFNWPPPKFYFTFKGYLGRRVTWILN